MCAKKICFNENLRAKGKIIIIRRDRNGNVLGVDVLDNLITNLGLSGIAAGKPITYLAWGTSSTAPANGNTTLVAEVGRKAILKHIAGATGIDTVRSIIEAYEAVGVAVAELGFFGDDATLTANSGKLYCRVLYSRTKTAVESWQVDRILTITRA